MTVSIGKQHGNYCGIIEYLANCIISSATPMNTWYFLYMLAVDWIIKTVTDNRRDGIQWTPWAQLDDLDLADDMVLHSHTKAQMQEKINATALAKIGQNISNAQTKILRANTISNYTLHLERKKIEEVDNFTFLGSIVDQ